MGRISTVAEEALSNIRTVRAFGMEDKECELLEEEARRAQELNEQLGWGIGLFQASKVSTLSPLNCLILSKSN